MRSLKTTVGFRTAQICVVLAMVAANLLNSASPSFATATPATFSLSVTQGPAGGGNLVVATTPAPTPAGTASFTAGSTFVEFQLVGTATAPAASASGVVPTAATAGCWPTYLDPIAATTAVAVVAVATNKVVVSSSNTLYITVPTASPGPALALVSPQTSAKYNICAYSSNTSGVSGGALLGQTLSSGSGGQYTIAAKGVITGLSPAAGPSRGGTTITVTGSFSAGTTATLGGLALTPLVLAADMLSFTAVTPPHDPDPAPVLLTVTTAGGTTSTIGSTTDKAYLFTYSNGVAITPRTAPNTTYTPTYITVTGVGFLALDFSATDGSTPDSATAHVYLVSGTYDRDGTTTKTNGEVAECTNVLATSDKSLLCSLNLRARHDAQSGLPVAATVRTVSGHTDTTAPGTALTAVTPPLTAADVGKRVSGTNLSPGTYIKSVGSDRTTAVLSQAASSTGTDAAMKIGEGDLTDAVTPTGGAANVVDSATGLFSAADVGRLVTGTGIAPNTAILAVNSASEVVLSRPATGAPLTGQAIAVVEADPVPIGTYSVVVVSDGTPSPSDASDYSQSVIASGSSYTVAPY
jgi:hypothetical protein